MPRYQPFNRDVLALLDEPMTSIEVERLTGAETRAVRRALHALVQGKLAVNLRSMVAEGRTGSRPGVYIRATKATQALANSIDWDGLPGTCEPRSRGLNFAPLEQAWRGAR